MCCAKLITPHFEVAYDFTILPVMALFHLSVSDTVTIVNWTISQISKHVLILVYPN